jgi:hypothetical protein
VHFYSSFWSLTCSKQGTSPWFWLADAGAAPYGGPVPEAARPRPARPEAARPEPPGRQCCGVLRLPPRVMVVRASPLAVRFLAWQAVPIKGGRPPRARAEPLPPCSPLVRWNAAAASTSRATAWLCRRPPHRSPFPTDPVPKSNPSAP